MPREIHSIVSEQMLTTLLTDLGVDVAGPELELNLSSLQVVTLVTELEAMFALTLTSRDVTRKNFRTVHALHALLAAKVAAKGVVE